MSEKAHASDLRKIRFAARAARRSLPTPLPPFWALTDPKRVRDPIELSRVLPKGGGLIYRHFGVDDRIQTAKALVSVARRRHLTLLIGNDPDLAARVGAHGVHWSEANIPDALKWRSRFMLMTAAAHSRAAIRRVKDAGIEAALVSTVFASNSPSAKHPMGSIRLRQLAQSVSLPIYGLGGIDASNVSQITHYCGFAAIEGFTRLVEI